MNKMVIAGGIVVAAIIVSMAYGAIAKSWGEEWEKNQIRQFGM